MILRNALGSSGAKCAHDAADCLIRRWSAPPASYTFHPAESQDANEMAKYDLVGLKAEIRELESKFDDLDSFQEVWDGYVNQLRAVVMKMKGKPPSTPGQEVRTELILANAERIEARSLLYAINPNYPGRTEFFPLLEPDLRVNPEQLLKSLSQDTGRMHWGTVPETFVSPNHLEAQLEECKGLVARHRLSLERQIREKKALLDEVEQQVQHPAPTITRAFAFKLEQFQKTRLGGFLTQVFADPVRKAVGEGIILLLLAALALMFPSIRSVVHKVWDIVASLF